MNYPTKKLLTVSLALVSLSSGSLFANGYYGYGYPPPGYYGPQAYPPVYPQNYPQSYPQAYPQAYPGQAYHPYYGPQPYMPSYPPAPFQSRPSQPMPATARQTEDAAPAAKPLPAETPVKEINVQPVVTESAPVEMLEPVPVPATVQTPKTKTTKSHLETEKAASDHKLEFIEKLLPVIQKQNTEILKRRNWLFAVFNDIENGLILSDEDQALLTRLQKSYRVSESPLTSAKARNELLEKVDIIPASLTLAQAANESAWGRSRFAREANNLFGIWTYDESQGLKPKNREKGKKHFVRKFDSIEESISYYMQMLNSHPAYAEMRKIRAELRHTQQPIRGHALAAGLEKYSAKGDKYIVLIRQLITQNDWHTYDRKRDAV